MADMTMAVDEETRRRIRDVAVAMHETACCPMDPNSACEDTDLDMGAAEAAYFKTLSVTAPDRAQDIQFAGTEGKVLGWDEGYSLGVQDGKSEALHNSGGARYEGFAAAGRVNPYRPF